MRGGKSKRLHSTDDGGEPSSSGPVRGKGGARSREPLPRHTGGDPEPCEPVHEPTTDSPSGEVKTGGGRSPWPSAGLPRPASHGRRHSTDDRQIQDRPSLRRREQSSLLKNRMREIRTSGSVRGGDGNIPAYSAQGVGAQPELARIVADDHRPGQQAVRLDGAPER